MSRGRRGHGGMAGGGMPHGGGMAHGGAMAHGGGGGTARLSSNVLAPFAQHAGFYINQLEEPFEIMTGFETNNQYEVRDKFGKIVLFAQECTDDYTRNMYKEHRPYTINFLDMGRNPIVTMRASAATWGGQQVVVEAPIGCPIATIYKDANHMTPSLHMKGMDGSGLMIPGHMMARMNAKGNVPFQVTDYKGGMVATITKVYGGKAKEKYSDADSYFVQFVNPHLPAAWRAVVMAATIHLDFVFFED